MRGFVQCRHGILKVIQLYERYSAVMGDTRAQVYSNSWTVTSATRCLRTGCASATQLYGGTKTDIGRRTAVVDARAPVLGFLPMITIENPCFECCRPSDRARGWDRKIRTGSSRIRCGSWTGVG